MPISVKICGLTSPDAIEAAVRAGAAYGGLVFHPKSPRYVPLEKARVLADAMRGKLKIVALIVDMDDAGIEAVVAAVKPELLQLHGSESARRVAYIRGKFGVPVIKALPVADVSDLAAAAEYESTADMLMFDARPPKGAAYPGGHGAAFDWKILSGPRTRPWFLAGGLDPDISRAIELSGALAVDVSSGVESAPGVKDAVRIADFVNATKKLVRA
ncbi:MAG: phosphoribosylanthranilate isomerase [Alphaproteobacteria bacterium]